MTRHCIDRGSRAAVLAVALALACVASCTSTGKASGYPTPQGAADALVAALRPYDAARLRTVLGSEGEEMLSSGDDVADRAQIDAFLAAYAAKHAVVAEGDRAVIVVGEGDWPLPIPVIRDGDSWHFDIEQGKDELLDRRIGKNELSAIEVCRAICDAQHEYAEGDRDGQGAGAFAARVLSTEGKHDGLFWRAAAGEPESPLGALVAEAAAEGYGAKPDHASGRHPYHGYFYRILAAQGPAAPGGKMDYAPNGRMTGGFAVLAEPAEYASSGVMTFEIGPDGVVYQCDLGPDTAAVAAGIKAFDPDEKWMVVRN